MRIETKSGGSQDVAAEALLHSALSQACARSLAIRRCFDTLMADCAVRPRDIVDSIIWPFEPAAVERAGWRLLPSGAWRHRQSVLPDIAIRSRPALWIAVEDIETLAARLGVNPLIEGAAFGFMRKATLIEGDIELAAVERRGVRGLDIPPMAARRLRRARLRGQDLRTRKRHFRNAEAGLHYVHRLVEAAVSDLGANLACALFLSAEREYWARHCSAAAVWRRRLDKTGLGWAHAEHYGYCVSRDMLDPTLDVMSLLGFEATSETFDGHGSSALVLEQRALRCTATLQFDHAEGPTAVWLHNAGIWTFLHGESILEGGLHFVSTRADADASAAMLAAEDFGCSIERSGLFTHQAIGKAEPRPVAQTRVDALERAGFIGREQAEAYRLNGAPASHLRFIEHAAGGAPSPHSAERRPEAAESSLLTAR